MNEEKKEFNLDFILNVASPPCVILAEFIAVFFTLSSNGGVLPGSFLLWLKFLGEILIVVVGIMCGLLMLMIVALIFIGGAFPEIDPKYINIALEIITLILAIIFLPAFV